MRAELTGIVSGRLTVLHADGLKWWCRCACGNEKSIGHKYLSQGSVFSCGCLRDERRAVSLTIHGGYGTPTYKVWRGMIERCRNPKATHYRRYGGRGISVCDRWLKSFANFLADMGPRPTGLTLDRYPNNDGNYEPINCRWATRKEQAKNRSQPQKIQSEVVSAVLFDVQSGCSIAATSRKYGIARNTIYRYLST